jgi:hypothetical protein
MKVPGSIPCRAPLGSYSDEDNGEIYIKIQNKLYKGFKYPTAKNRDLWESFFSVPKSYIFAILRVNVNCSSYTVYTELDILHIFALIG